LATPKRDRDQVGQERGPEAERERDGQLVEDEVEDVAVAEEALAEVERQVAAEHQEEALVRGAVETVLALQALHELGVEALGAAVATALPRPGVAATTAAAEVGAGAGVAGGGVAAAAGDLADRLLHRATRRQLHDGEVREHDPEQRRDDQDQAAEDVGEHRRPSGGGGAGLRRGA
jgi:hypothetical protein